MANESLELEDGELVPSVVHGPSAADDVQLRARLHEAAAALRHRGQRDLARLALGLVDADLRDAVWVLNDQVRGGGGGGDFSDDPALFDTLHHRIRGGLLSLQETGYSEHVISEAIPPIVLEATLLAAEGRLPLDDDDATQPYRGGGFGAVPASAAAVRCLERQTFLRVGGNEESVAEGGCGIMECSICFEEFVDGGQVTVMPCPSRVHKFHPDCISKWLAISNMCPLCRYELPAYY